MFFQFKLGYKWKGKGLWLNLSAFESPKIQDYCDLILFIRNKQGQSYDIICPPKSQKIAFFRYFLSLNKVNLKFKEPLHGNIIFDVKGNFISFK